MSDEYKELLEKYNLLHKENKRLKRELALLKGEDSLSMPVFEMPTVFSTSTINKYSSSEEKISLLLRGKRIWRPHGLCQKVQVCQH